MSVSVATKGRKRGRNQSDSGKEEIKQMRMRDRSDRWRRSQIDPGENGESDLRALN